MKSQVIKEVEEIIALNSDIVNFGTIADAVDSEWIVKAESILNRPLSESYKWFLNTYSRGEIGGNEIYSIYGLDFYTVNGGDIVFQYLMNKKIGILTDNMLVVCETNFGEIFFFNYSFFKNGECPIWLRLPSGDSVFYAIDFYDFIKKQIEVNC